MATTGTRISLGFVLPLLLCGAVSGGEPEKAPAPRPDGKVVPAGSRVADAQAVVADPFATDKTEKKEVKDSKPQASYEELLKDAVPVSDLATLIEPLYARCDEKDDVPRRQCEGMRGFLLDRLKSRTFVTLADAPPETSPWDAVSKEIEMEVSGCIVCGSPPTVGGEPRLLSTRPPQRIVNGHAAGVPLSTHQLPMETKVRADRFLERAVPRLRIEHIFRVGAPFGDAAAGKAAATYKGVTIIPVAHRVYDRCTGLIAAASAPSKPLKVKPDKTCPPKGEDELSRAEIAMEAQRAALPERLTSSQVEASLQPIQEKIHECYVEFSELAGTVKVQLTVGGEGKLTQISLGAPFDKADIGVCIRSQLKTAVFPKFRGEPMRVSYAFQVN